MMHYLIARNIETGQTIAIEREHDYDKAVELREMYNPVWSLTHTLWVHSDPDRVGPLDSDYLASL